MTLNDFWRHFFGEDVSPFEEKLVRNGAEFMTPEEPLFAIFAAMVRILHSTLGESEKALLRYAPEMTHNAQSMIQAAVALERRLNDVERSARALDQVLCELKVSRSQRSSSATASWPSEWVRKNIGPLVTSGAVFLFCAGFVTAAAVH